MIEQEFKNMIREAINEETKELKQELRELREMVATERISVTEAKRILGFKDQRTAKNHLEKAGVKPSFDRNGNLKYIKKDVIDYARNKDFNIVAE